MTVVETAAEDLLVGMKDAEGSGSSALRRAGSAAILGTIVAVQLGWLAGFGYAAYMFIF